MNFELNNRSKMYRTIQAPYQSARGSSADSQIASFHRDEKTNTNKFPIKKFSNKFQASVNSHPSSPNTDRMSRVVDNSFLRKSHVQTSSHLSIGETNSSCQNEYPLNFLSNYQYKNLKRNGAKEEKDKRISNPIIFNHHKASSPLTLEEVTKKILMLTERISKNEAKIEMIQLSEIVPQNTAQANGKGLILQENRLINNQVPKGQEGKDFQKEIETIKKKVKQCQEQLSQAVPKKDFQMRIQSLEWKIKEYSPSNLSFSSIQRKQCSEIITSELERSLTAIRENFESKLSQLNCRAISDEKEEIPADKKQNVKQIHIRSNRFAVKTFSFQHSERFIVHDPQGIQSCSHTRHNSIDFASYTFPGGSKSPRAHQQTICETIYHIDLQGYLLDTDKCYLIDSNQRQIKLSDEDIRALKQLGLFDQARS